MSFFEMIMLVCFAAAWPASIWKSYTTGRNEGKSLLFLCIILIGYISGTLHKIFFSFDLVTFFYVINGIMVSIDIALFYRNAYQAKNKL